MNHRKSTFSHCLGAPLSLPLTKALCVALDGWATAVAPPLPGAWFSKSFSHGNWTRFAWKLGKELAMMEKQPGLMKHGFWFAMMEQLNWKEACLAKTKAMIETRHLKLPSGFLFIDIYMCVCVCVWSLICQKNTSLLSVIGENPKGCRFVKAKW